MPLNAVSAHGEPRIKSEIICQENSKPWALDWQLIRVRVDTRNFRSSWIEGYCSRQGVLAGGSLDIMVSAKPSQKFRLEIFRPGYYGVRGTRKLQEPGSFDAQPQPTPESREKNLHECRWDCTTSFAMPADWPSGVYLGRMLTIREAAKEAYWQSYITFVVRDEGPIDILFPCSDNTWQAFNRWPNDFSLNTHPRGVPGPWADVSLDRPYELEVVGKGTAWVRGMKPPLWTATIYPGSKGNFAFNPPKIFWTQCLSTPAGHGLPWPHWSRPHRPHERSANHPQLYRADPALGESLASSKRVFECDDESSLLPCAYPF